MGLGHKTLKVALRFLDIFKLKLCLQEIYKKTSYTSYIVYYIDYKKDFNHIVNFPPFFVSIDKMENKRTV